MVANSHMGLFTFKFITTQSKLKFSSSLSLATFLKCSGAPCGCGCHVGQHRYGTFLPSQKVLLDSTGLRLAPFHVGAPNGASSGRPLMILVVTLQG